MDYLKHGRWTICRWLGMCIALLLAGCMTLDAARPTNQWRLTDVLLSPAAILSEPMPMLPVLRPVEPGPEPVVPAVVPPPPSNFLSWNFWASDSPKAKSLPDIAKTIKLNKPQFMWFRVSSIDHSLAHKGMGKIGLSGTLGSYIDQQKSDERQGKLDFFALVVAADPTAIAIPKSQQAREFSIDMDKLATSPPTSLGTMPPEQSLDASTIGEFSVEFTALKPGKHRLGIVLVEKRSGIPMQTLSIEVSPESPGDNQIASLGKNVGLTVADTATADFSLVLYDLPSESGTSMVALLIAHDHATGANRFFSWNTGKGMAELQGNISAFRSSLETPLSPEEQRELSWQFGRSLFEPVISSPPGALSPDNQEMAGQARAALLKAARDSDTEARVPTLLVRLVPSDPRLQDDFFSPTLPVGSIALGDSAESAIYLGERMIVALLLPGHVIDDKAACPDSWYVAKPPQDIDVGDAVSVAARDSGKFWEVMKPDIKQQSLSLAELKGFLVPAGNDSAKKSVVISYLGHNRGKGELYIKREEGSVASWTFRQKFTPSSVAIINACEVATDVIEPGSVIGALSKLRVGTMIATISPVSGQLAGAYMRCMASVLSIKKELTVGELQLRTTQCLFSKASGEKWGGDKAYFSGRAMNYFLVGNPYQKICSPKEAP
ncbi:hypothetical protein ACEN9F_03905 [Duganella sp. CT11-25]|jgi:hypothetical protein|uniref:hypothetical protein n=1 Tax=unclassified Duganella TaxID=2636909 RepID=UPI0039AF3EA6